METEKIKIPIKQAFPMLSEVIRFNHVTKILGKSSSWIYTKLNCDNIITTSKGFNQKDIDSINAVLYKIGETLLKTRISEVSNLKDETYATGSTITEQLKSVAQVVSMPYIYINKLGKNGSWYRNRLSGTKVKFKEEELTVINMAIVEIGNKLLSIELTL